MACKLAIQKGDVQIAVDENNFVFIRVHGPGYRGHQIWGTWQHVDLNFNSWKQIDKKRLKPIACASTKGYKPLENKMVDYLELITSIQ